MVAPDGGGPSRATRATVIHARLHARFPFLRLVVCLVPVGARSALYKRGQNYLCLIEHIFLGNSDKGQDARSRISGDIVGKGHCFREMANPTGYTPFLAAGRDDTVGGAR